MSFLSSILGKRQKDGAGSASPEYDAKFFKSEHKTIADSGLFDAAFYGSFSPDLAGSGMDAIEHYLKVGAPGGRNPHPCFDAAYYLDQNPEVARGGGNAFAHYLSVGSSRLANPHPLFDSKYYFSQFPQVDLQKTCLLAHFLAQGAKQGARPNPYFDSEYYLRENGEVASQQMNPLVHFLLVGAQQARDPSRDFDIAYYLSENPDALSSGRDALTHYVLIGRETGRRASPAFDCHRDQRDVLLLDQLRRESQRAVIIVADRLSPEGVRAIEKARAGVSTAWFVVEVGDGRERLQMSAFDHGDVRLVFERPHQDTEFFTLVDMLRIDELRVLIQMGTRLQLRWLVERLRLPYVLQVGVGSGKDIRAQEGSSGGDDWKADYDWLVSGADELIT